MSNVDPLYRPQPEPARAEPVEPVAPTRPPQPATAPAPPAPTSPKTAVGALTPKDQPAPPPVGPADASLADAKITDHATTSDTVHGALGSTTTSVNSITGATTRVFVPKDGSPAVTTTTQAGGAQATTGLDEKGNPTVQLGQVAQKGQTTAWGTAGQNLDLLMTREQKAYAQASGMSVDSMIANYGLPALQKINPDLAANPNLVRTGDVLNIAAGTLTAIPDPVQLANADPARASYPPGFVGPVAPAPAKPVSPDFIGPVAAATPRGTEAWKQYGATMQPHYDKQIQTANEGVRQAQLKIATAQTPEARDAAQRELEGYNTVLGKAEADSAVLKAETALADLAEKRSQATALPEKIALDAAYQDLSQAIKPLRTQQTAATLDYNVYATADAAATAQAAATRDPSNRDLQGKAAEASLAANQALKDQMGFIRTQVQEQRDAAQQAGNQATVTQLDETLAALDKDLGTLDKVIAAGSQSPPVVSEPGNRDFVSDFWNGSPAQITAAERGESFLPPSVLGKTGFFASQVAIPPGNTAPFAGPWWTERVIADPTDPNSTGIKNLDTLGTRTALFGVWGAGTLAGRGQNVLDSIAGPTTLSNKVLTPVGIALGVAGGALSQDIDDAEGGKHTGMPGAERIGRDVTAGGLFGATGYAGGLAGGRLATRIVQTRLGAAALNLPGRILTGGRGGRLADGFTKFIAKPLVGLTGGTLGGAFVGASALQLGQQHGLVDKGGEIADKLFSGGRGRMGSLSLADVQGLTPDGLKALSKQLDEMSAGARAAEALGTDLAELYASEGSAEGTQIAAGIRQSVATTADGRQALEELGAIARSGGQGASQEGIQALSDRIVNGTQASRDIGQASKQTAELIDQAEKNLPASYKALLAADKTLQSELATDAMTGATIGAGLHAHMLSGTPLFPATRNVVSNAVNGVKNAVNVANGTLPLPGALAHPVATARSAASTVGGALRNGVGAMRSGAERVAMVANGTLPLPGALAHPVATARSAASTVGGAVRNGVGAIRSGVERMAMVTNGTLPLPGALADPVATAKSVASTAGDALKKGVISGAGALARRAALPVAVVTDVVRFAEAEDKGQAAASIAGGWTGAAAGAQVGATWGALGGPLGGVAGAIVGGAIGYAVGSGLAEKAYDGAKQLWNSVFG